MSAVARRAPGLDSMSWHSLKRSFKELLRGEPGRRFQAFHARRCRERSRAAMYLRVVIGAVLIVIGVLLSMPPLVPGFLVTFAGLGLIASQSLRVAQWMDRLESWLRRR